MKVNTKMGGGWVWGVLKFINYASIPIVVFHRVDGLIIDGLI